MAEPRLREILGPTPVGVVKIEALVSGPTAMRITARPVIPGTRTYPGPRVNNGIRSQNALANLGIFL